MSKRIIDHDLIHDYVMQNPRCEIAPYFSSGRCVVYRDWRGREVEDHATGGRMPLAEQVHHILGSGNGCQRHDVVSNIIHVSLNAHEWLEQHKIAGMVLCCHRKREKGEIDWRLLSELKGKRLPDWFETDQVVDVCRHWTFVEAIRRDLCG